MRRGLSRRKSINEPVRPFWRRWWSGHIHLHSITEHGNYINWLADSYFIETHEDNPDVSDGNTRFTFDIVRHASWSDGKPISANDVSFTLNYYIQGDGNPYGADLSEVTSVYAPNDYTVIVEFDSVSYWHLSTIATKPILPYHVIKSIDPDDWTTWDPNPPNTSMVTSGPYYVSEYVAGEYTELSANQYYFKNPRLSFTQQDVGYISNPISDALCFSEMAAENQYCTAADGGGELTWTSRENPNPTPIANSSRIVGNQLVITATWPDGVGINNVSICMTSGIRFRDTDSLVIPDSSYDLFEGSIDVTQLSWMYVDGIKENDVVHITSNFSNTDCDFIVFWADSDNSTWRFEENLIQSQMSTLGSPENAAFWTDRNGTIAVGCFDYSLEAGEWTLEVATGDTIDFGTTNGRSKTAEIYDWDLDNNYNITATAKSDNTTYIVTATNISVISHYEPSITLLSPNSSIYVNTVLINWTISDNNERDTHRTSVFISKDNGSTYQLYSRGVDWRSVRSSSVSWNQTGWTRLDSYRVKVVVQDSSGLTDYDISDQSFTAGEVGIIDDVNPIIIGEEYHWMASGSSGNSFEWLAFDLHPSSFEVWYEGVLIRSGSWESGLIHVDCDQSEDGFYNYTLRVADEEGITTSMTTWVASGVTPPIDSISGTIPTGTTDLDIPVMFSITITIVSVAVIIVFGTLIVRSRMVEQNQFGIS
ncbi:MAG: ABC transporter substrate-binding protein [Candidatus Thorarchaeota archaeon]|nr:ABC transporter substrate-binding protein [Candidatus Thorarchaeota archaeon]